jgi:Mn-dependent DtxR family transcriptional regulator
MNQVLKTTLKIVQERASDTEFTDLVNRIVNAVSVDEATAKAAILRLGSEGLVEITPEWHVHLTPVSIEASKASKAA